MKKTIIFSTTLLCISCSVFSQATQFVVTTKGDTAFYDKVTFEFRIAGHKANGEKVKYDRDTVSTFLEGDGLKEVITKKRIKGWSKTSLVMLVLVRNRDNGRILYFLSEGMGPATAYFYYFDKTGFVSEVDKHNYKDIISQNFSCPEVNKIIGDLDSKKAWKKMSLVHKTYIQNCDEKSNVGVKISPVKEED